MEWQRVIARRPPRAPRREGRCPHTVMLAARLAAAAAALVSTAARSAAAAALAPTAARSAVAALTSAVAALASAALTLMAARSAAAAALAPTAARSAVAALASAALTLMAARSEAAAALASMVAALDVSSAHLGGGSARLNRGAFGGGSSACSRQQHACHPIAVGQPSQRLSNGPAKGEMHTPVSGATSASIPAVSSSRLPQSGACPPGSRRHSPRRQHARWRQR